MSAALLDPPAPPTEDATRRELLGGAAAGALVLAGCGADDAAPARETRTVTHALGRTRIPSRPQRIFVTDELALDAVLSLGVEVVAATTPPLVGARGRQFEGLADGLPRVGDSNTPNLERITGLRPDVIVGFNLPSLEPTYRSYSRIAPTVAIAYDPADQTRWPEQLRDFGDVLAREAQADERLADYAERVAAVGDGLADALEQPVAGTTASIVRVFADGSTEYRTPGSFPVSVLDDLGFARPPQQERTGEAGSPQRKVSGERVDLLDGDVLFAAVDPGAGEAFDDLRATTLWRRLGAARADRVFPVDSSYWVFGNVLAAAAIVDDVERQLVAA